MSLFLHSREVRNALQEMPKQPLLFSFSSLRYILAGCLKESWCSGSVALDAAFDVLTACHFYLTGLPDGIRTDRFDSLLTWPCIELLVGMIAQLQCDTVGTNVNALAVQTHSHKTVVDTLRPVQCGNPDSPVVSQRTTLHVWTKIIIQQRYVVLSNRI